MIRRWLARILLPKDSPLYTHRQLDQLRDNALAHELEKRERLEAALRANFPELEFHHFITPEDIEHVGERYRLLKEGVAG